MHLNATCIWHILKLSKQHPRNWSRSFNVTRCTWSTERRLAARLKSAMRWLPMTHVSRFYAHHKLPTSWCVEFLSQFLSRCFKAKELRLTWQSLKTLALLNVSSNKMHLLVVSARPLLRGWFWDKMPQMTGKALCFDLLNAPGQP